MTRWIPCREFVEFLDDYLAGRLSGEALAEFNNHLSGCPPCVIYMRTYREASRLGRRTLEAKDEPVPDTVPEKLVQAGHPGREAATAGARRVVTCRDFVASLDDFISAEAALDRLEALDGHLAGCVCCTIYTETYLQTILLGRRTLLWKMV